MTGCEEPEFAAFDACIRSQLAGAAETYISQIDISVRLKAVLAAGNEDNDDDTAAADT